MTRMQQGNRGDKGDPPRRGSNANMALNMESHTAQRMIPSSHSRSFPHLEKFRRQSGNVGTTRPDLRKRYFYIRPRLGLLSTMETMHSHTGFAYASTCPQTRARASVRKAPPWNDANLHSLFKSKTPAVSPQVPSSLNSVEEESLHGTPSTLLRTLAASSRKPQP